MPKKDFAKIVDCCYKKCYEKINLDYQKSLFSEFYNLGCYDKQNYFLRFMLKHYSPKSINGIIRNRLVLWKYLFPLENDNIVVCKKFLSREFQISLDRLDTIQNKILNKKSLYDSRGKHFNHKLK